MNPIESMIEKAVLDKLKAVPVADLVSFVEAQLQAHLQSKMGLPALQVSSGMRLIEGGVASIYAGIQALEAPPAK